MSPRSSLNPTLASGDVAEPGGRHRRPESLADVHRPISAAPNARSHRHEAGRLDPGYFDLARRTPRYSEDGFDTATERRFETPRPRAARSRRNSPTGRHSAAVVRQAAVRPPMGSHRAPGTLPIEAWLLMGKKRQQVLLASLIAAGLLLLAVPAQQRQGGLDAVDAAAARAIGAQSNGRKTEPPAQSQDQATPVLPAVSASASPGAKATASPTLQAAGHGPAHSLRTTGTTAVALTFDDGPDPVQTPKILALLAQYQIKATFCLVGQNVQRHPEIVRQIVAEGHTLCNHTWNHSLTIGQDKPDQIRADLAKTNAAIHAAVPDAQIPFFRAPGGNFTDRLVSVAARDGMTSLYWEVDPRDWEHPSGESNAAHIARVIAEIHKSAQPGAIVLSHDFNQPDTIAAYAQLLPWLKENFQLGVPGEPVVAPTTTPSTAPTTTPATQSPTPNPAASADSANSANSADSADSATTAKDTSADTSG